MLIILWFFLLNFSFATASITPYKYEEQLPSYEIPETSRFIAPREQSDAPEIVYYLSCPEKDSFPIAILCGGSCDLSNVSSIIHFHRYFLEECMDLGLAVLTVEQWGIDGSKVNKEDWIQHYTRSQRLEDHQNVIEYLQTHPIEGWNGKFVFIGVSEGGPLVTRLSEKYNDDTLATINWSGAGNWSWREELWVFLQNLIQSNPECPHDIKVSDCSECFPLISIRSTYDDLMDKIIQDPDPDKFFLNMTYRYHSDAMQFTKIDYSKLKTPYLVVSGAYDTIIDSADEFVSKAEDYNVPITYYRIPDMDHFIRKRPKILQASFEWLATQIK